MDFKQNEMAILKRHNISADDIFDGSNITDSNEKNNKAELAGKTFVYGYTCTKDSSHFLKTRSGHCIICNPAAVAFQRRTRKKGYVYIAGSLRKKLIKIGFSTSIYDRETSLNSSQYAGCEDWKILTWIKAEEAGSIEDQTKMKLTRYLKPSQYFKSGKWQDTKEVFSCSFLTSLEALNSACRDKSLLGDKPIDVNFIKAYCDFPNI